MIRPKLEYVCQVWHTSLFGLRATSWNQSKAARALGISRYHMRHRIKKYSILKPSEEAATD